MIFDFLKKQKDINKRKKIISVMILSLEIHDVQKELYLEAVNILNIEGLENLYKTLIEFTKEIEIKELEDINKNNFSEVA